MKKSNHLYKKKQVLFYEGNPALGVYCLQSGRVKVYKTSPEGKQHILFIGEAGDTLGLESLFASDHHTSTAEMFEGGIVCFIDRETLFEVLHKNIRSAFKAMEILAKGILVSEEERMDLAQSNVRERMARLLTLLSERHGTQNSLGIHINLNLSREEIAGMIGTASETAMRLLKEFKEEKIIELQGRNIIILNQKQLAQRANLLEKSG